MHIKPITKTRALNFCFGRGVIEPPEQESLALLSTSSLPWMFLLGPSGYRVSAAWEKGDDAMGAACRFYPALFAAASATKTGSMSNSHVPEAAGMEIRDS